MTLRDMGCGTLDASDADDGSESEMMRLFSTPATPLVDAPATDQPLFAELEERAIDLARHDSLASLEAPGFVEKAVRLLFGLRAASRAFADERLESLRRAVVVTRHRHHLPDAIAHDLRTLGFSAAQLRAVESRALAA